MPPSPEWAGPSTRLSRNFRGLPDLKDIDAVLIAAPDHWSAIITILACQAAKYFYAEKPTSPTIREGRAMLDAARAHKRVVQTTTQHRSASHFARIAGIIRRDDFAPSTSPAS